MTDTEELVDSKTQSGLAKQFSLIKHTTHQSSLRKRQGEGEGDDRMGGRGGGYTEIFLIYRTHSNIRRDGLRSS
jgi:hypothetical protein